MRSRNGRHRRPRQAPSVVVAAGATGAGLAMPLLGAAGAHAATPSAWDRVAECESGGLWHADSGDGFYGGLQLTLDLWQRYGGTAYAPRPDLAGRSEQIAVAESILAARGPYVWPLCAQDAGLTGGGAPGAARTPGPTESGGASAESGSASAESGGGALADDPTDAAGTPTAESSDPTDAAGTPTAESSDPTSIPTASVDQGSGDPGGLVDPGPGDPGLVDPGLGDPGLVDPGLVDPGLVDPGGDGSTDPATTPGPSSSPSAGDPDAGGAGRHRGGTHPQEGSTGLPADSGPGGRHASRGAGDGDGSGNGSGTGRADGEGATGDDQDGFYAVRPGDNLSVIAERHDLPGGWPALYRANKGVVGADPDLIRPGQLLDLDVAQR